jgi:predicted unusual protein kinase regulating ubiquinone biosynthesis (AarF/ABC1/UbiB family)
MMRLLFGVLARFANFDLRPLLLEIADPLLRKLDLHVEGETTEAFREELRPLGVVVPKVYWQFTSPRVLTLECVDGVRVDDGDKMRAWKIDRRALAKTYVRSFWHQVFHSSAFQIDPHPRNVLTTREGQLSLLDFGLIKRIPKHVRIGLQKELFGAVFREPKLYVDGLIEKGMMDESDRVEVERWARKTLRESKARPVFFDSERRYGIDPPSVMDGQDIFPRLDSFRAPREGLLFMRALGIVIDVCRQLVPEVPVNQVVMPVLLPFLSEFVANNPEYVDAAASAVTQVAR